MTVVPSQCPHLGAAFFQDAHQERVTIVTDFIEERPYGGVCIHEHRRELARSCRIAETTEDFAAAATASVEERTAALGLPILMFCGCSSCSLMLTSSLNESLPCRLGAITTLTHAESHPTNLLLQAQHLILTGVRSSGPAKLVVMAINGTIFRFSPVVMSSSRSVLPHFGQRAQKTRNFGGSLCLLCCGVRMSTNDSVH